MVKTTNSYGTGTLIVWALVLVSMCIGCSNVASRKGDSISMYQIDTANRSAKDIRFVVIDPDSAKNQFGFLASGGSGKTSMHCRFSFAGTFAIAWEEDGTKRTVPIDIKKYEAKKAQIKSFGFYYLGNGKWQVIARSGTNEGSPEVKP